MGGSRKRQKPKACKGWKGSLLVCWPLLCVKWQDARNHGAYAETGCNTTLLPANALCGVKLTDLYDLVVAMSASSLAIRSLMDCCSRFVVGWLAAVLTSPASNMLRSGERKLAAPGSTPSPRCKLGVGPPSVGVPAELASADGIEHCLFQDFVAPGV